MELWVDSGRMPVATKATLFFLSSMGQGRENTTKGLWVKERTGEISHQLLSLEKETWPREVSFFITKILKKKKK